MSDNLWFMLLKLALLALAAGVYGFFRGRAKVRAEFQARAQSAGPPVGTQGPEAR